MKHFLAVITACVLLNGCGLQSVDPVNTNRLLKTTHSVYMDIRTVVTDPEVRPMFSPAELEKLAELERQYLAVTEILKKHPNNEEAVQQVSQLATEILGILGEVEFVDGAKPYIAAIRISTQLLKNHLP